MDALNSAQLEILKLFENQIQTAEDLIALRKTLHDFLKKKNKPKVDSLEKKIFEQVKAKVLAIDPEAKIILFGSRARGDQRKESDWDFLVLVKKELTNKLEDEIRDSIYDIELEVGEAISTIVKQEDEWQRRKITQFYKNVSKDGIEI
jgi:uncharacterized protein